MSPVKGTRFVCEDDEDAWTGSELLGEFARHEAGGMEAVDQLLHHGISNPVATQAGPPRSRPAHRSAHGSSQEVGRECGGALASVRANSETGIFYFA
ncbi:hypothetical protein BJY26_000582 [Spelaeicoccus albus]|uniref:Uncharacterized protein n=1 Tax=Spelaeicoccus albus TaxID=1280376 RepID=A0A7Z0ABT7_9MICO|nr:hypothetical protein [Spelaeicoccus albus]